MIIGQSNLQLVAAHQYRARRETHERTTLQVSQAESDTGNSSASPKTTRMQGIVAAPTQRHSLTVPSAADANGRLQMLIVAHLYKQITGQDLRWQSTDQLGLEVGKVDIDVPVEKPKPATVLVYERDTHYEEIERLQFAAEGKVVTQEGQELAINVSLTINRSFAATTSLRLVNGEPVMQDPLIVNFDGKGAQLESTRFAFDLDADGTPEQIANLRSNSGYLALDRNGDGVINNGKELFGPSTNDGFAELAAYDEDKNGFIDEGDSIYHQLRIWLRESDGTSTLLALGDRKIGAIYLGNVSSPLQLKDDNNNLLGEVVSSGVYLREDGTSGIVQQVNLAV